MIRALIIPKTSIIPPSVTPLPYMGGGARAPPSPTGDMWDPLGSPGIPWDPLGYPGVPWGWPPGKKEK